MGAERRPALLGATALLRAGLEHILAVVCAALMAGLAVLVLAAVIFRELNAPIAWSDEVASVGLAWVTYYGSCLAALKRGHLGFPSLVTAMPAGPRLALLLLGEALVLGFLGIVAWYGYQVIIVLEGDTLVSLPWVPVTLTQSVIPIGATLFILAELLTLPERIDEALRGLPPGGHEVGEEAP
jgi:TRAP-type C4-dicarboxylate transport system permease small subunit